MQDRTNTNKQGVTEAYLKSVCQKAEDARGVPRNHSCLRFRCLRLALL
jgi:hypothetical protein